MRIPVFRMVRALGYVSVRVIKLLTKKERITMKPSEVRDSEYREYYGRYISEAPDIDINKGLEIGKESFVEFTNSIHGEKFEYRYDEGKWTIKEVIQHLIDTERLFSYRAFHFARRDKSPVPGFDQDHFVKESNANSKTPKELLDEYLALRNATISLFASFTDEMWQNTGVLYETPMSARAAGFVIVGHEVYHQRIIEERYL